MRAANGGMAPFANRGGQTGARHCLHGRPSGACRRRASQWYLDVAPAPAEPPRQYDLLVAAQRGQTYWDCFPAEMGLDPPVQARQRPLGWRGSLPDVLAWLRRSPGPERRHVVI